MYRLLQIKLDIVPFLANRLFDLGIKFSGLWRARLKYRVQNSVDFADVDGAVKKRLIQERVFREYRPARLAFGIEPMAVCPPAVITHPVQELLKFTVVFPFLNPVFGAQLAFVSHFLPPCINVLATIIAG